jgi:putative FmdB family regulatory protein
MPVYEYECSACSHRFEEWQKINDKPVKVCPKCKARKVERLISHTSFQLKGSGWYGDLYSSQRPANTASTKPDGGADGKAAGSASSAPPAGATAKETTSPSSSSAEDKSKGSGKPKTAAA